MRRKEGKADRQDQSLTQIGPALAPAHDMQTVFDMGGGRESCRDRHQPEIDKDKKKQDTDIRHQLCRDDQQLIQKTYAYQRDRQQSRSQQEIAVDRGGEKGIGLFILSSVVGHHDMSGRKGIQHCRDHHGILGDIFAQRHKAVGLTPKCPGDHRHQQQRDQGIDDQGAAGSDHGLQQPEIFICPLDRSLLRGHILLFCHFLSVRPPFSNQAKR